jgi:uncharacterized membrane protein YphA (DoxX/SURF4 family)
MNVQSKLPVVARVLLGLPFVVFGLNGFLQFLPQPPMEGDAATFMGGLAAAGYFFPLLKATEIAAGLALLSGRFVPLALVVLAPIVLQIFAFHAFLAGGVAMSVVFLALGSYLAWAYRDSFRGVLEAKARPAEANPSRAREVAHA